VFDLEMLSPTSDFFGGIVAHNAHRVRMGSSKRAYEWDSTIALKSRFFEDPDAATACGSIMRFAKGLRGFDFAWCARNERHAAVRDIKF
jgi:hypothetical protein